MLIVLTSMICLALTALLFPAVVKHDVDLGKFTPKLQQLGCIVLNALFTMVLIIVHICAGETIAELWLLFVQVGLAAAYLIAMAIVTTKLAPAAAAAPAAEKSPAENEASAEEAPAEDEAPATID